MLFFSAIQYGCGVEEFLLRGLRRRSRLRLCGNGRRRRLVGLDGEALSRFISALLVFPPVYRHGLDGSRQTDRKLLELARVYRIPFRRRLWGIFLPQVLPYFRSASSLALGLCWKAGAAAEVIGLPAGTIGERLYMAKVYFQTPDLFAWTAAIVAVSAVFERHILKLVDAGKAAV